MKTNDKLDLPRQFAEKAAEFPESSMGANRVTLVLSNGKRIQKVILAWGETIVRIGNRDIKGKKDIDFEMAEIVNVISEL